MEERGWALIRKLWRDWSPGWELPPEEWAQLVATFEQPGVKKAALAYYRSMAGRSSEAAQRTRELLSGPFPVRTLALTGALAGAFFSLAGCPHILGWLDFFPFTYHYWGVLFRIFRLRFDRRETPAPGRSI